MWDCVTYVVVVASGVAAVTVLGKTPTQAHAVVYLAAPEQGDAYAGMIEGAEISSRFFSEVGSFGQFEVTVVVLVTVSVTT